MDEIRKIYKKVKDIYTWENFLKEIEKRKKEYNNLLDEEAIALIIADECGRWLQVTSISDLKPNGEYTIRCKVVSLLEPIELNGNKPRKGFKLEVEDETGRCNLILWEEHMELVDTVIKEGTPIKVINGYTRLREGKIEINVGKWGLVEIDLTNEQFMEGIVMDIGSLETYFTRDGSYKVSMNVEIEVDGRREKLKIHGKSSEKLKRIRKGEKIKLKWSKDAGEIYHVDDLFIG